MTDFHSLSEYLFEKRDFAGVQLGATSQRVVATVSLFVKSEVRKQIGRL